MSATAIAKLLGKFDQLQQIDFLPYSINDIDIKYGVPPVPVIGLHRVSARYQNNQKKLFKSLTGGGVFASNANQSGFIEFEILNGSPTCGGVQLMSLTGIPFPITVVDLNSGGTSTVISSACQQTVTPEWRKEATPGTIIYTFETPRLLISQGVRLPDIDI